MEVEKAVNSSEDMISLVDQPEEIVEMVLRHMDSESRREVVEVCQTFYELICRLKIDDCVLKLNKKTLMDENIFNSIITSKRRISKIEIAIESNDGVDIGRLIAVITKFKKHLKELNVKEFPECSAKTFSKFLDSASGVKKLSLAEINISGPSNRLVPVRKFEKLEHLQIGNHVDVLMAKVKDDTLESLGIYDWPKKYPLGDLQALLNRQRNIKQLNVRPARTIKVDHLKLEKLQFCGGHYSIQYNKLIPVLMNQHSLVALDTDVSNDEEFVKIGQMRNLRKLKLSFDYERPEVSDESFLALRNLEKLEELTIECHVPSAHIFNQIELPMLTKLTVKVFHGLKREHFVALGRSLPNLRHLRVNDEQSFFLAVMIDEFPGLKTLLFTEDIEEINDHYDEYDEFGNRGRPSRQHLNLEEIVISKNMKLHPFSDVSFAINFACPNLKRIHFNDFVILGPNVLDMIQRHPRLTHFSAHLKLFCDRRNIHIEPPSNRWLPQVLDIFRNSPDFIHLALGGIWDLDRQLVIDWLSGDSFKVLFPYDQCLEIRKKSSIRDPHENFAEHPRF